MSSAPLVCLEDIELAAAAGGKPRKRLSLKVEEGCFLLISGANGLGKSYVLNLIAGLVLPEKGRVLFSGKNAADLSEGVRAAWRRRIGFIPAKDTLLPGYSVKENLELAAQASKVPADKIMPRIHEAMNVCGVTAIADRNIEMLSSGQKKRALVARSLVNRPQIILADSPLESLDSKFRKELLLLLSQLPQLGYTVVLTSAAPLKIQTEKLCTVSLGDY